MSSFISNDNYSLISKLSIKESIKYMISILFSKLFFKIEPKLNSFASSKDFDQLITKIDSKTKQIFDNKDHTVLNQIVRHYESNSIRIEIVKHYY